MDNLTLMAINFAELIIIFVIFAVLIYLGKYAFKAVKNVSFFKTSRFFNPQEYLPEEELSTIKQVFYLIIIVILVIDILYHFMFWEDTSFNFLLFDIIVCIYLAIQVETTSYKDKFILFCLIPVSSFFQLVYGPLIYVSLFDVLNIFVLLYFIKQYYEKFLEYTEENSLGITIMLLFLIVFISFIFTIFVEGVTPLDSIEMVSNAFTSNGYSILGNSAIGKMNAIFLVWSGFILSGVGTATLTVAIVMRHVDEKFDHLEELVKRNKKE